MKKIITLFLVLVLLSSVFAFPASADASMTDYFIASGADVAIPDTYTNFTTLNGEMITGQSFNAPADIFVDEQDFVYVVDTGNNRVVKIDPDYNMVLEVSTADGKPFASPQGIFVDELQHMYVADTGNARIVHLSPNGEYIESFVKPESSMLASIEVFNPTKVIYNRNTGFIYIILGKQLLTMDSLNEFKGFFAANKVGFSLKNLFIRKFATQEQKMQLQQDEAVSFHNAAYKNDKVYATTYGDSENIKVINNIGTDLFKAGSYGEVELNDEGFREEQALIDITANKYGIITVAQQNNGKIYQYDNEGRLLLVFGGKGSTSGYFELISSIETDSRGRLYVMDSSLQILQVFEPTHFTSLIHEADSKYNDGDYDGALELLEEIRLLCPSYTIARDKMGSIYYKQQKYDLSMREYKAAKNQAEYAKAFEKDRYSFMQKNFLLTVGLVLAAVVVLFILIRAGGRLAKKIEHKLYFEEVPPNKAAFMMILLAVFHPISCFDRIKHYRKKISGLWGVGIIFAVSVLRILQIYLTNYTASDTTPEQANFILEMATTAGLVPFFAIICFLVTALRHGEVTLKENFLNCTYSLAPVLFVLPLIVGVSWFVGATELVFYDMAITFLIAWCVINILVSVHVSSNYTVKETAAALGLTFLSMVLVAIFAIIFVTLAVHTVSSLVEMYTEITQLGV